jgi:hypothetical protein
MRILPKLILALLPKLMQALLSRRRNRWRGLVLGAVGGAAGTMAMGLYFKALSTLAHSDDQSSADGEGQANGWHALDDISLVGKHYQQGEGSTEAVGRIAYQTVAGKPPKAQETKALLSEAVHWSFGTSMGALREQADWPDLGAGLAFGSAVWLFASELLLPLLRLAPGPTTSPAPQHAKEFGAHRVYGAFVAVVTQELQRLFAWK